MSQEEDFDIVPDDEQDGAPRSTWLWIGVTAVVALFAFGVGAAYIILSNRMGPDVPTVTPTVDLALVSATQVALVTTTGTVTPSSVITVSRAPTGTATATVTPTPTPTPFCTQQMEPLFVPLQDQSQFGCPTEPAAVVWAAYQPFERGSMLWRSDSDTSYVFYANGAWAPITEGWDGGPMADRGAPPPGLQAPERGFGFVWSRNDEYFNGLGWARDQEKGFCALVQDFEKGFMLRSTDVPSCTEENLYNFAAGGDWTPLVVAAAGNNQWSTGASAAQPTPSAPQNNEQAEAMVTRPAPQGVWDAYNGTGFTVDGSFDEWPDAWIPINALVYSTVQHEGPGDLSANFQLGWTANGLMIAVRVNDNVFRAGPNGTDLWQGDSIEVQFDSQLAEDINSDVADADDYQVGIALNSERTAIRGYLWLPLERETELNLPGAFLLSQEGYQIEVLIPWYVFGMDGPPATDRAYGFNLSVNDNDSEQPTQELVLSASPARTTHDDPTEWGTLRLLP